MGGLVGCWQQFDGGGAETRGRREGCFWWPAQTGVLVRTVEG